MRMKVAKQRIGAREGIGGGVQAARRAAGQPVADDGAVTHDDTGTVVEWGRHLYRASHYDFSVTLVGR